MGGLRNTTHQVYTTNIVILNHEPLLRYEWIEEGNVLSYNSSGDFWGHSDRGH